MAKSYSFTAGASPLANGRFVSVVIKSADGEVIDQAVSDQSFDTAEEAAEAARVHACKLAVDLSQQIIKRNQAN